MKTKQPVVLDYQDNFADNFSILAYASILEHESSLKCYYENKPYLREKFEKNMSCFNLDFDFISTKKVNEIVSRAYVLNKIFLKDKKLFNRCIQNNTLFKTHFEISDIPLISEDILSKFRFKNTDFIKNYDILDEITNRNSIGLFINSDDNLNNENKKFIEESLLYLNKFLKQPKLFVFSKQKSIKIDTFVEYEIIDIMDWREEYYFLSKCKNHIILNTKKSYCENFWASLVYYNEYSYTTFKLDKNEKKYKPKNWLLIN